MQILSAFIFASILTFIVWLIVQKIKLNTKSREKGLNLSDLDDELWKLFSRYIRSKDADWKGEVKCFTCDTPYEWKYTDAGHCIPKAATGSFLKFEERNVKPQCKICNQVRGGMRKEFERRLQLLYGEGIMKELKTYTEKSLSYSDYKQKIEYYKQRLKLINSKKTP